MYGTIQKQKELHSMVINNCGRPSW